MMNKFEAPEIQVVKFSAEDIITMSGGGIPGDENLGGSGQDD